MTTPASPAYRNILRFEWVVFLALVIYNLLPVLSYPFFPTSDGPAHLYNANVMHRLFQGHSEFLSQYYTFNHSIVPNWTGHALLMGLYMFFPAVLANKVFVILCLCLLPLSFRYCVKKINAETVFASYLIFPFTYTFMFCMGFYNFTIGLIVLFFTLGRLMEFRRQALKPLPVLFLFILFLLGYLSHLFIFLSIGLFLFFAIAIDTLQALLRKESWKPHLRKQGALLLALLLPLVLMISYFSKTHGHNEKIYLLKSELLQWITICRSVICYNMEAESMYATGVFLVFAVLFSAALYMRSREFSAHSGEAGPWSWLQKFTIQDVFLVMALAFLYLYFRLPDADTSAGFISSRLNLMFFLCMALWVSGFRYPQWMSWAAVIFVLYLQYNLVDARDKAMKYFNDGIGEVMSIEPEIRDNTVILPVTYGDTWMVGHQSNYLGINKPVVILENYECNNTYFPLSWKSDKAMIDLAHADFSRLDKVLQSASPETMRRVDYIFVQGKKSFPDSLKARVQETYTLRKETENMLLFERKRP